MKNYILSITLLLSSGIITAQAVEKDTINKNTLDKVQKLDEVIVKGVRVKKNSPIAHTNLTKKQIASRNLGQNTPIILNYSPSVVTYSDEGLGVGYTYMRVRGTDSRGINVTINGIPYNDSESQGVFWANINDISSSVQDMQLQRGVGTSTNGGSAFGASLNLLTDNISKTSSAELANSFGSFNTRKHTIKLSTGKINDHFEVSGRFSQIKSDGYIDRGSSDLSSYFLQTSYTDNKTVFKALVFGGKEKTGLAWKGISKAQINKNRRFNSAGMYTNKNGKLSFYDNETDNYWQDHYQFHWSQKMTNNWSSHIGLHYTKGKGYYENYKPNKKYTDYGLSALPNDSEGKEGKSDIVIRKWLDNDFYGTVYSVNYKNDKIDFILGGGLNHYSGDHFGKILWTKANAEFDHKQKFYDNNATKIDGNIYAKSTYKLNKNLEIYGDLQFRNVKYKAEKIITDENLNFFNPKAGLNYLINTNNNVYASYGKAHREPNRSDYEWNKGIKPEELDDFEIGWRFTNNKFNFNVNTYYMLYNNQLVLTGEINDEGAAIKDNVGKSYRAGIEIEGICKVTDKLTWSPNLTYSSNKAVDHHVTKDDKLIKLGDTKLTFSPDIVFGNNITYSPIKDLQIALLSKYVSEQYMNKENDENTKIDDYFVSDISIGYQIYRSKLFKSINLNLLINNIMGTEYVSNGNLWYGTAHFYPQATRNYLAGITFKL